MKKYVIVLKTKDYGDLYLEGVGPNSNVFCWNDIKETDDYGWVQFYLTREAAEADLEKINEQITKPVPKSWGKKAVVRVFRKP